MNYNKWSDSHSKWPNSDVWWDPHIYAFYEINSAAVTGTGFKLPGSFPAESVPSSDVRYIQKAELQWRRHAVSCQATERGACRCRSVYRQVPKNLHPGWKVGHLKKKKRNKEANSWLACGWTSSTWWDCTLGCRRRDTHSVCQMIFQFDFLD